jgi:hypothetical protein
MFVLTRQGKLLSNGDFFYSTRGIYERFQDAVTAAQGLWRLDRYAMSECAEKVMFTISEHRVQKTIPRVDDNNRMAPLRRWYWVPTQDSVFFPMDDLRDLQGA